MKWPILAAVLIAGCANVKPHEIYDQKLKKMDPQERQRVEQEIHDMEQYLKSK